MDDLRSEIRAAFQKEQAANPPTSDLRARIGGAVALRPRRKLNLQWMAVAAAIVLAALVVAGLMSTRLLNRSAVSVSPHKSVQASPNVFYLEDPTRPGFYIAFDWNGQPVGVLKLSQPIDPLSTLVQAPDGSAFQVAVGAKGGETLFDRIGNPIPGTGGIWADDSVHTCRVSFDQQKFTWTAEAGGVGQATRPVALIATDSGEGQTGIRLVACSFKNDRVVAVRTTVSWPSELWVVRLSDGAMLKHVSFHPDGQLSDIVASPDGALVAENSPQSVGLQGGAQATSIRRLSDNSIVASLDPSMGVLGFSADNSLALVTTSPQFSGSATHLAVIRVATGKIIWRYDGNEELAGYFTEPTGAVFALMLKDPHDSNYLHPKVGVVMVLADGKSYGSAGQFIHP